MRAIQCLIISIFAILSASGTAPWGGYLGKYLLQRPFIGGLICGIVFGDITQGILIGAAMQLVYIGYFNVGGVQSIDMGIISFPCVAIAMMSGIDTSAAIALATGLGALFTTLEMLCRTVFFPSAGALMKKVVRKPTTENFPWLLGHSNGRIYSDPWCDQFPLNVFWS